jgi:hypothetical protein
MHSSQIRHKNFHTLFQDFIARHPGLPRRGMLKLFAEHLALSDRYLSHIKCQRKNIGHKLARAIEARLELPHGWLDREHHGATHLPANDAERLFIETALLLFRSRPEQARELMLQLLREQLAATSA